MILDFAKTCNTYTKEFYTREYFKETPCPKCEAVGRFTLHGSYGRHVLYFVEVRLVHKFMYIKRIKCRSCKSTHAVMPGDLIPYKLLSLFVLLYVLVAYIVEKTPALKVAEEIGFSFQFIYLCLSAFALHKTRIHLYFMETLKVFATSVSNCEQVMNLIKKPYLKFQRGYLEKNRRPCFMRKFFYGGAGPPIGLVASPAIAT